MIFDMDGVVTETARVHAAAWKRMFDEYLKRREGRDGEDHDPFDMEDYRMHVDGIPRYEGARRFLESRGIEIPFGEPSDPPEAETVCGLGNRKNGYFIEELEKGGARAFDSTMDLVRKSRESGIRLAVISASRNARKVLESAGVLDMFDEVVGGAEADRLGLSGKPAPDIFLEAARRLKAEPGRTAVFEDAIAGVEAASAGGFYPVVGVDRAGHEQEMRKAGADIVIEDISNLEYSGGEGG